MPKYNNFYIVPGVAIASSINQNNYYKWSPQYATDGLISNGDEDFFHSNNESNPWLQYHLPKKMVVTSVVIANRKSCCGNRLNHVEVRAGMEGLEHGFRDNITINEICGTFEGPGEDGVEYTINCSLPIMANYITVQILDTYSILQINELRVITDPKVLKGINVLRQ